MNASPSLLRWTLAAATLALAGCADTGTAHRFDATSQGTLVANTRASAGGGTSPSVETAGIPEGVLRRDGRLYYVKDRGITLIRGAQRLTNGLYLERNGEVTLADGRHFRVLEGWMVTVGGDVIEAPTYLR